MFVYKTDDLLDETKRETIDKLVKFISQTTNDTGIIIPLDHELLLDLPLNVLYDLKNKINEAITIKKCGNY